MHVMGTLRRDSAADPYSWEAANLRGMGTRKVGHDQSLRTGGQHEVG